MKLTIGKLIGIILLIIYWIGILIGYCYLTYNMYLNDKLIAWYTIGLIIHLIGIIFAFIGALILSNLFCFEKEYMNILDKIGDFIYYKIILQIEKFLKTEIKIK